MLKFKILNNLLGLIFSVLLAISFFFLGVPDLKQKIIKIQQMYSINSTVFTKIINLPRREDYIIKIKYNFKNTDGDTVTLNGNKLELKVSNESDVIRTRYYYAPEEVVKRGKNYLKIEFYPSSPQDMDLRIRNYIASTAGRNIVITLENSMIKRKNFMSMLFICIFFFLFSFGLWRGLTYVGKLLNLPINQILFNNILSFLPWTGLYFILGIISISIPFSLAVSPAYLFLLLFWAILISNIFLNLLSVLFLVKTSSVAIKSDEKGYKVPKWLDRLLSWLKTREFSEKCILFFMFLLIMCAFLLILEMEWLAEQIANIAYFALVMGVMIKFIKFLREEKYGEN